MSPGSWILPALAFLSGLASLQIDPQKEPKKKWILIGLLVVTGAGTILVSRHDDQQGQLKEQKATQDANYFKDRLTDLTGQSKHLVQTADQTLQLLQNAGVNPQTIRVVQQAQAADASRTAILRQTQASNEHDKAVVWYFPKNVDGDKVNAALEQGGFSVIKKSGNPANEARPTNAIWVGDDVNLDQAKFVALTLIRAGVEIKSLRRLGNGGGDKAKVIEVGADAALDSAPPLSAEEVSNLSELKR